MDPLVQGLAGAVAGLALSKENKHLKWAALCGAYGGVLPDADIFIRSVADPLMAIEYHRHFTHSLAFIPFGGVLAAAILWIFLRKKLHFFRIYLYATAGLATHGIVDATTSYGTHLAWPFSNARESWSFMAVVDPVVTILLLFAVIGTLLSHKKKWLATFCALTVAYFGFGALQNHRVTTKMQDLAEQRGHEIAFYEVKPTLFNSVLWRSTYVSGQTIHIDAIRVSPMGDIKHYEGTSMPLLDIARDFPTLDPNSTQAQDIERFRFFSAGFLGLHPQDKMVIGDMRYAMLPQSDQPLWAIRITPEASDQHVAFQNFRQRDAETLNTFQTMLKGDDLLLDKNDN